MNITETLEQIRKIVFNNNPAPAAPVAAAEPEAPATPAYTLADGTPVEIDKLEVGGVVTIQGMPAPEGEIVLADGTKLTVDANGVITAVVAPEAPAEPAAPASEDMAAFRAEFESVKTQLSGFATSFGQLQTDFATAKETISKQDQAINLLLQAVEQLSKVPSEAPAQTPKGVFARQNADEKDAKFEQVFSAIKEVRTKK